MAEKFKIISTIISYLHAFALIVDDEDDNSYSFSVELSDDKVSLFGNYVLWMRIDEGWF